MKWLILAALILLVAVAVKGQLDFNRMLREAHKKEGGV